MSTSTSPPASRFSTRSGGSPTRQTGYDLRGASYARLRHTPLQWPCPPDDDARPSPDPLPQRRGQPGPVRRCRRAPTAAGVPHPVAASGVSCPPAHGSARAARRRLPVGAQHRSAAAPVAHHDQDRQGRPSSTSSTAGRSSNSIRPTRPQWASPTANRSSSTSRRGRAVLPAVLTERVRPGNCFVPFHWNDEHGEYLTVNAVTNDAVDADSLQPEFKVCAVRARPVGPAPSPVEAHPGCRRGTRASRAVGVADRQRRGLRRSGWPDGWATRSWSTWTMCRCRALAAARDVLIVTSTFGDGGPPDNGAGFWDRLGGPDAPALDGVRYAVLGIGDRSYADFCGHAKSIDGRFAALGASKLLDRAECEAYDDGPMSKWADEVAAAARRGRRAGHRRRRTVHPRRSRPRTSSAATPC